MKSRNAKYRVNTFGSLLPLVVSKEEGDSLAHVPNEEEEEEEINTRSCFSIEKNEQLPLRMQIQIALARNEDSETFPCSPQTVAEASEVLVHRLSTH